MLSALFGGRLVILGLQKNKSLKDHDLNILGQPMQRFVGFVWPYSSGDVD